MAKVNLDKEFEAYERKERRLSKENAKCLDLYWEHLKDLSLKVKCKHIENVKFYLNTYLAHYELSSVKQGAKKLDDYFGDFFIRKCMWSTPETIKTTSVSIKKFYQCMLYHEKINKNEYDFLCETIKNNLTKWQNTCARFNDGAGMV